MLFTSTARAEEKGTIAKEEQRLAKSYQAAMQMAAPRVKQPLSRSQELWLAFQKAEIAAATALSPDGEASLLKQRDTLAKNRGKLFMLLLIPQQKLKIPEDPEPSLDERTERRLAKIHSAISRILPDDTRQALQASLDAWSASREADLALFKAAGLIKSEGQAWAFKRAEAENRIAALRERQSPQLPGGTPRELLGMNAFGRTLMADISPPVRFIRTEEWEEVEEQLRHGKEMQSKSLLLAGGGEHAIDFVKVIMSAGALDPISRAAPPEKFVEYMRAERESLKLMEHDSAFGDFLNIGGQFRSMRRRFGQLYLMRGMKDEARDVYQEEIERCRASPAAVADRGRILDSMGILEILSGEPEEARRLFEEGRRIRTAGKLPDEARSWLLLASLHALTEEPGPMEAALKEARATLSSGDFKALPGMELIKQNIEVAGEARIRALSTLAPAADLAWQLLAAEKNGEAYRVMEVILPEALDWLGEESGMAAIYRQMAAICSFAAGQKNEATELLALANRGINDLLASSTWMSGYEDSTLVLSQFQNFCGIGSLSAMIDSPELMARELILQKGHSFHGTLEKRRLSAVSSDPAIDAINVELRRKRSEHREQVLIAHQGRSIGTAMMKSIPGINGAFEMPQPEVSLKDLETELGLALDHSPPADDSLAQMLSALPADAAYVDFALADRWQGKTHTALEWCAVVLRPGAAPAIARCGLAAETRQHLARYRQLASMAGGSVPEEADLTSASRALYDGLIAPVEKLLSPDIKTVFVCPDGPLAMIGLGALLDKSGNFWCERRNLRYVTGAPALLAADSPLPAGPRTAGLFGDPSFDRYHGTHKMDFIERRFSFPSGPDPSGAPLAKVGQAMPLQLTPLSGTADEVRRLGSLFETAGWSATPLTGPDANEEKLKSLHHPTILHLATHGCFLEELPNAAPPDPLTARMSVGGGIAADPLASNGALAAQAVSPMLRSFLALAGAQPTYDSWIKGRFPKSHLDGILMADEVMDMDLSQTLLVTLSACKTGVGESVRGEGAVGIQRAFLIAGARHVMATLWPISDDRTVEFMEAFYRRVLAGESPPSALAEVQRQLLLERRKDLGLAHAVNLTAPFVVVSSHR